MLRSDFQLLFVLTKGIYKSEDIILLLATIRDDRNFLKIYDMFVDPSVSQAEYLDYLVRNRTDFLSNTPLSIFQPSEVEPELHNESAPIPHD